jgi:hypothetical protein
MSLKVKGVTYDVGMPVIKGELTRESLPLDIVKREMLIIANKLHCTAVRITGQDLGRLKMAVNSWFPVTLFNYMGALVKNQLGYCYGSPFLLSLFK